MNTYDLNAAFDTLLQARQADSGTTVEMEKITVAAMELMIIARQLAKERYRQCSPWPPLPTITPTTVPLITKEELDQFMEKF
jgi:hypothetical protein